MIQRFVQMCGMGVVALLPMGEIAAFNTSMMGARGIERIEDATDVIPLPDGLFAVEYVEATGTQKIVLPYIMTNDAEYDMVWQYYNTADRVDDGFFGINGLFQFRTRYAPRNRNCICRCYRFVNNGPFNYVDNVLKESNNYSNFSGSLCLFNFHDSLKRPAKGRIYWLHFYKNGELYFDLVPVRDESGIGYMYDLVSGELFGNNGTGSLIVGPDL